MIKSNLISVLIPVCNGELTLRKCLDSVLGQSYADLEVLLFDDGSTDGTSGLIQSYMDERVSLIQSKQNIGIAKARNELLKVARGEFIAWIDADDYMLPTRLEEQVNFLRCSPEVSVLGTSVFLRNYKVKERSFYPKHSFIHSFQFYKSCTLFPTFLTRNFYEKEQLFFKEEMGSRASDFEWIYRVGGKLQIANLDLPLTSYYVSSSDELKEKWEKNDFKEKSMKLLHEKLALLGLEFPNDEIESLHRFLLSNNTISKEGAQSLYQLFVKVRDKNRIVKLHDLNSFEAVTLLHCLRLRSYSIGKAITLSKLMKDFKVNAWLMLLKYRVYYH